MEYCTRCKRGFQETTANDPYGLRCGADDCPTPECEQLRIEQHLKDIGDPDFQEDEEN